MEFLRSLPDPVRTGLLVICVIGILKNAWEQLDHMYQLRPLIIGRFISANLVTQISGYLSWANIMPWKILEENWLWWHQNRHWIKCVVWTVLFTLLIV